ncbi:hypothetical protein NP493_773g01020, partial [Ridgeia piscesae]
WTDAPPRPLPHETGDFFADEGLLARDGRRRCRRTGVNSWSDRSERGDSAGKRRREGDRKAGERVWMLERRCRRGCDGEDASSSRRASLVCNRCTSGDDMRGRIKSGLCHGCGAASTRRSAQTMTLWCVIGLYLLVAASTTANAVSKTLFYCVILPL